MNFCNTACFYIRDGLGPKLVYRARERTLFRIKPQFFIPIVGFPPSETAS